MTLLAFGCSVTHGTEIVASGNSKDNIPYSYPALIAKYLGIDCVNYAFCGNSNENIFHEAMDVISHYKDITGVLIGWTSDQREVWHCSGRTWQFAPRWCSTSKDIWQHRPVAQDMDDLTSEEIAKIDWTNKLHFISAVGSHPSYCADQPQYLPVLEKFYQLLIEEKFDIEQYSKKTQNYVVAFRAYCEQNKIKLMETCWEKNFSDTVNIGLLGNWYPAMERHPNVQEHQLFAECIIDFYKI